MADPITLVRLSVIADIMLVQSQYFFPFRLLKKMVFPAQTQYNTGWWLIVLPLYDFQLLPTFCFTSVFRSVQVVQ